MEQYIIYNAEHKVLICKEHKCGISPRRLDRHFRDDHQGVAMAMRKEILAYAKELPLCDPEQAPIFKEVRSVIHGLQVYDGYRCHYESCQFYTPTLGYIKRHCRDHDSEGWNSVESKFTNVKIQTWFQGNYTRYQ